MRAKSSWRFFPAIMVGALGFVMVVNFYMAYAAVHSFPGTATDASFATSNRYDAVLAAEARQEALGWHLGAATEGRRAEVTLADRDGHPLEGARVVVMAQRPAGGEADRRLELRAIAPGRYLAATDLPDEGQWDLQVFASAQGREFRATRRVLVP